jgi:thioredoxin 1
LVQRYIENALHVLHPFMKAGTKLGPSDFNGKCLKKSGTVAVLFAAEWCPFCRRFSPIFESALAGKGMLTALADLSDLGNPLWETFDIQVVPTVVVFKDGELIHRMDGVLGQGLPDNAMSEVLPYLMAGRKAAS